MTDTLTTLYQTAILEHNRNPVGFGELDDAGYRVSGSNPVCGDSVELGLFADESTIQEVRFAGNSCAICTASASMLCEHIKAIALTDTLAIASRFVECINRDELLDESVPGALQVFAELQKLPTRKRCATLPWTALLQGITELRVTDSNNE